MFNIGDLITFKNPIGKVRDKDHKWVSTDIFTDKKLANSSSIWNQSLAVKDCIIDDDNNVSIPGIYEICLVTGHSVAVIGGIWFQLPYELIEPLYEK